MGEERRGDFPIVRRGYETERVDAYVDAVAGELDRLAAENRSLHRRLADATVEHDGIILPVRVELEAARAELDRLVRDARAERDRATAETAAARSELDRLTRARVDVHRELSALGEALRKWMGAASAADDGTFLPPPSAALVSKTGPPVSPTSR